MIAPLLSDWRAPWSQSTRKAPGARSRPIPRRSSRMSSARHRRRPDRAWGRVCVGLVDLTTAQALGIAGALVAAGFGVWVGQRRWRQAAAERAKERGREALEIFHRLTEEEYVAYHKIFGMNADIGRTLPDDERERLTDVVLQGLAREIRARDAESPGD